MQLCECQAESILTAERNTHTLDLSDTSASQKSLQLLMAITSISNFNAFPTYVAKKLHQETFHFLGLLLPREQYVTYSLCTHC